MRLDPLGLTGPPTSKKWRGKRRKEEEKKWQLWLSSLLSSSSSSSSSTTSFVECLRSDCAAYASSRSSPGSICDRVADNGDVFAVRHHYEARHHEVGHGPDEKAGTATAFRISRDSVSRGEVRARTRDRHEDHEDEDDNDGDALRARTRTPRVDHSSPRRRRVPRFARGARRGSRRRRRSGAIPEERPDVATSAVSFVDVHAYTAYSNDRDDDDDGENDDDDHEGQAHRKQKGIYSGIGNRGDAHVSALANPRDRYEHENANENAPREDYTRAEVDATSRGAPKSDQWTSQSSSFDGRKDRECIDGYGCAYPTVDEVFDGQGGGGGECSERTRSDNTAWCQKPIIRRKGRSGEGEGGGQPRIRRSYYRLLLFVLYLLAWPLLCTSSPSGHLASTFAQNPTLAHAKDPAQRGNVTPSDTLFSSSPVIVQQYQHSQQYVQGSDYNTDSERHRYHQQKYQQQRKEQEEQLDEQEKPEHPYNEYTWAVNQMNPWLSACDLAGPEPTDLQGTCGPSEVPRVAKNCPKSCGNISKITKTYNTKTNRGVEDGDGTGNRHGGKYRTDEKKEGEQCLYYLEKSNKEFICENLPKNNLYLFMVRLPYCCEHAVFNALAPGKGGPLEDVLNGGEKCKDALDKLLRVDLLVSQLQCEFEEVLARYDCAQPYSVIHNCTHCKEAYRKWVCSSLVPYFAHRKPQDEKTLKDWIGLRLRSCRSFCQSVEQRCPYFLPGDRAPAYPTQYAGEPTFLCRDPNIHETGEQAARALHSIDDDECCFHVCSEDTPGEGICTNCKEPWKHGRVHDPATAPQCDMNLPQSATTVQPHPGSQAGQLETSTDRGLTTGDNQDTSTTPSSSSTAASSTTTGQKDTAFCGSGRIGSISSASSPGRSSPPVVLQLFWLCSILISLPANALQYNAWRPSGCLRLIGSGLLLSGAFVLRRTLNDLRVSTLGPRSTGIYRLAVRCLLFVLGMPERAVMKCRRRGWWWWRSWRRSGSRHFRWKFPRRFGVASRRSVLRDVSVAILELFLKFAARCRCRDWWWLWRRWRKCGSTHGGRYTGRILRRRRSATHHRAAHRRRGRRRDLAGVLIGMDVATLAKSTSRKDPP
ncbi:uncharacterized protein LOC105425915 [Pogonomyrmex barbatus]|uniref:Uncharacterized protein LOC105425915 n=1 Tax=Pogonomyrmex barbatus TaxID=144034 RepID=A0A6I9W269_9HYME|nr:uncharacterized protein LOC105425915 [Pogonomyrmex barbatus]